MLIFVKKKEYERLKDLCKNLKEEKETLLNTIKEKNKTVSILEKENKDNKKLQNSLSKTIVELSASNDKMISWIKTIIHDVGSYEVNERNTIKIPLYKEERIKRSYFDQNKFGPVESSIKTHVPSIDFIETTQFGCDYGSGFSMQKEGDLNE